MVDQRTAVRVSCTKVLSRRGSNRGTAYPQISNKIVTARGQIFVTWLDRPSDVRVCAYDVARDRWGEPVLLGRGQDNHGGAALTLDSRGRLYAVFGPHHGPFQLRCSLHPYDAAAWGPVERFGLNCTYPSLVCGPDDTLHLVYRGGPHRFRLLYQQRPPGGVWSVPRELVDPCTAGYTHFWHSLLVAADGALHLGFSINRGTPFLGTAVGYLYSADGGQTWLAVDGTAVDLPVTPQAPSPCFLEWGDYLEATPSNLALDGRGRPWLAVFHRERRPYATTLWHHDGRGWQERDLLVELQGACLGYEHAAVSTVTFDRHGRLYVAAVVRKAGTGYGGTKAGWGEPGDAAVLLTSDDGRGTFKVCPISPVDPRRPQWLANIERPYGPAAIGTPSLLYTHGGSGTDKRVDEAGTEIVFVRLATGSG